MEDTGTSYEYLLAGPLYFFWCSLSALSMHLCTSYPTLSVPTASFPEGPTFTVAHPTVLRFAEATLARQPIKHQTGR